MKGWWRALGGAIGTVIGWYTADMASAPEWQQAAVTATVIALTILAFENGWWERDR